MFVYKALTDYQNIIIIYKYIGTRSAQALCMQCLVRHREYFVLSCGEITFCSREHIDSSLP